MSSFVHGRATVDHFLAYAVPLEQRRIQEAKGAVRPFPAFPPCPECAQPVTAVVCRTRSWTRYSIGLGCHRLVTCLYGDEGYAFEDSLLARAVSVAKSLEAG